MHSKSQCFQNPQADEDTKKLACRIAPKSPAAQAYLKEHPELTSAPAKAPAYSPNVDKDDAEGVAGMTIVEAAQPKDIVAAAFDDPNPQSIIIGHGKLAFKLRL